MHYITTAATPQTSQCHNAKDQGSESKWCNFGAHTSDVYTLQFDVSTMEDRTGQCMHFT